MDPRVVAPRSPDPARRRRRDDGRRFQQAAARAALLRRRRSFHPRLRLSGDRTAQRLRSRDRRHAPAGGERGSGTLLHARLGHRRIRGFRRRLRRQRFPRADRRGAWRALAFARRHGARGRRRADQQRLLSRRAVAHRDRTRPVTRARKWLLGLGLALAATVALLAAVFPWLLYTPSGLRFALDRASSFTHAQFTWADASGTLARGV